MNADIIVKLNEIIKNRKENPSDDSYTCQLLSSGDNRIIKKIGEENAEFIRAFLTRPESEIAEEAADCIYHLMVALRYKDIDFGAVTAELEKRHIMKSGSSK